LLLGLVSCTALGSAPDTPKEAYQWHLPPGFPVPAVPADNPMSAAKVELGRQLFSDAQFSLGGSYSCASCHRRALAFTDGRSQAIGATGDEVRRSALSLANVAYNAAFTWGSSRVRSLEAQMRTPLFNRHPVEMGVARDGGAALAAINADPGYRRQFLDAFGATDAVSLQHFIQAIAAYERTLISGRAAFDRYVFDDDATAMSEEAKRGMALFYSSRVGCVRCHSGLNFSGPIRYRGQERASALFADNGLPRGADRGLMEVTGRLADLGKFKVPTLRNIALTAPYMHDGSLPTLRAVLAHYMRGGPRLRPFQLSDSEQADLLAFLESLTDRTFVSDPLP
jgi:cytochrome c peroxidase